MTLGVASGFLTTRFGPPYHPGLKGSFVPRPGDLVGAFRGEPIVPRRVRRRTTRRRQRPQRDPVGGPAQALYSPGEVVARSGISRQVLHNYTVLGLLRPAERTETGRRYYDASVFRRIRLIRRMLDAGYTLQSLREIFPWGE